MQVISTLFRFVFWFLLGFSKGHGLFECLANFIQTFLVKVMHPLGAFGIQVDQLGFITHGLAFVVAGMPQ
ncbi:hypothetical protein AO259_15590 [Pseudomonas sp. ICMP 564]|nr:hypothetical protein AO259_15590 [Pseudomonas sp. ICMP 564]